LSAEYAQLDLRHVVPAAVLGRVVDLQLLCEPLGLGRIECLVENP
jgi:hypothetical protein